MVGARRNRRHSGICGQAPSDYPELAEFLVEHGIDSLSVTPDALLRTLSVVRDAERKPEEKAGPKREEEGVYLVESGKVRFQKVATAMLAQGAV